MSSTAGEVVLDPELKGSPDRLKHVPGPSEGYGMTSGTMIRTAGDATSATPLPEAVATPPAPEDDVTTAATYRRLFGLREFRALFAVDLVSLLGDQVAAVAVSFLLYQRSGSALIAALGYATAYLPWFVGGPLLATWAERLPPRTVMIGCDLLRAALIGVAAIPGVPLAVLAPLVLLAATLAPPFDAVCGAVNVDALPGDTYTLGMSVRTGVHQVAQLLGFAFGGALVALVGTHVALGVDAVSFLLSAALIRSGVRARPAAATGDAMPSPTALLRDTLAGFRAVATDARLRVPLILSAMVAACVIVPEAIATAYADALGGGPGVVGVIMASTAGGTAVGALVIGRLVRPDRRPRLLGPLGVASGAPLLLTVFDPGLPVCLALFALAGAASSVSVVASTMFGRATAPGMRARAFAVAMACLYGGQVVAIILGGWAATLAAPHLVVAGSGALGVLAGLALLRQIRGVVAAAA